MDYAKTNFNEASEPTSKQKRAAIGHAIMDGSAYGSFSGLMTIYALGIVHPIIFPLAVAISGIPAAATGYKEKIDLYRYQNMSRGQNRLVS